MMYGITLPLSGMNQSKIIIYVDGKVDKEYTRSPGKDVPFVDLHRIGADNRQNSPWLKATIDEFMIYGRALSQSEVNSLIAGR